MNHLDFIMDYEAGNLTREDEVRGFAAMIADGTVWHLQGHYHRTAVRLIESGLVTRTGEVVEPKLEEVLL